MNGFLFLYLSLFIVHLTRIKIFCFVLCFVGRIGFAFSLVEPEEVAFMLDVHMLLGKELDASYNTKKDDNINILTEEEVKDTYDADTDGGGDGTTVKMSTSSSSSVQSNEQCSYTLETMTPDLVQTG